MQTESEMNMLNRVREALGLALAVPVVLVVAVVAAIVDDTYDPEGTDAP